MLAWVLGTWLPGVRRGKPEWGPALARRGTAYSTSHAVILLAGAIQLYGAVHSPYMPPYLQSCEAVAVVVAACIAYVADVLVVGRPSSLHLVDLALATALTLSQALKLWYLREHPAALCLWMGIATSLACRGIAWHALRCGDLATFKAAHAGWHYGMSGFGILFLALHATHAHARTARHRTTPRTSHGSSSTRGAWWTSTPTASATASGTAMR